VTVQSEVKTERPEDLTERERWQWAEAEFCDLMVRNYQNELLPGWTAKSPHPSIIEGAYRCAIYKEAWEAMARHLRQPYYARKEADAYRAMGQ
jgi:hypothetical protein